MSRRIGQCMCGACRFEVDVADLNARACHCADCRRWTGGAVYVLGPFPGVRFNEDAPIEEHRSSDWASRGFCRLCGSSLFWRSGNAAPGALTIMLGALDDQSGVTLVSEIFCDQRSPVIPGHPTAKQFTRADVIDRYKTGTRYDGAPKDE